MNAASTLTKSVPLKPQRLLVTLDQLEGNRLLVI
jgi:hypothetical protein